MSADGNDVSLQDKNNVELFLHMGEIFSKAKSAVGYEFVVPKLRKDDATAVNCHM
jgi:hypothetical protein